MTNKFSTLSHHETTTKHQRAVACDQQLQSKRAKISIAFEKIGMADPKTVAHSVRRAEVACAFMVGGIPFERMQYLAPLLNEHHAGIVSASHMAEVIPVIHEEELARVRDIVQDQAISVTFDGTGRLGETLVVMIRTVSSDMQVRQTLARCKTLARSLTGMQLSSELADLLWRQLNL
jgi:hypothetical protein